MGKVRVRAVCDGVSSNGTWLMSYFVCPGILEFSRGVMDAGAR